MKNIAIFIPTLRQGGAEKQAILLATMLDKHCNVDMYLLYGNEAIAPQNIELLNKSNVKIHPLKGGITTKLSYLKRELIQYKTDILFNYLTSCNVIGAIAGKLAGIKRIYSGIRNARIEWYKMVADRIVHNHLASASIFNCHSGAQYFSSKGFWRSKNIVIPNGFIDIAEPIVREDRDIKHIVTVGRFVPQKDYKTIITTISILRSIRQDFVLDIVGYGTEEENIRKWIDDLNVGEYVDIHIKPDNVQEIVRNADVYLSTSLYEGTSNSIMEALNWSLPVVATNVGDNKHLIIEGKNGMLHPIGAANAIAHSINTLFDSIELRNAYGIRGHSLLKENYSMEIFEERYLHLIDGFE